MSKSQLIPSEAALPLAIKMHYSIKFILLVMLIINAGALPNVFEYEIEKAKEFVQKFEVSNKGQNLQKNYLGKDQRKVRLGNFSWKDCSNSASSGSIKSLSITPDPLAFPGPLNVQTEFVLKQNLVQGLKGEVLMQRRVLNKYIRIPCLDNFGSCTYNDICGLLDQVTCPPALVAAEIPCRCPVKKGSYSLPKSEFDISAAIIPTGDYHIVGNLTLNGQEAGCLDLYLSVA